ncbi:hypothetical protein [Aquibacillus salsiterrae]|nr:hypothetical protein [Aquibacillus salsiterrae]
MNLSVNNVIHVVGGFFVGSFSVVCAFVIAVDGHVLRNKKSLCAQ